MYKARKVLSHLNVIFAGMFLTFFIFDKFNPTMSFIDNEISKWLLCCFSLAALALAILNLILLHRRDVREAMKEQREADTKNLKHWRL